MHACLIIEVLDPVNYIEFGKCSGWVAQLMNTLDFQSLEETFDYSVVPTIGLATHRLNHGVVFEQLPVLAAGVLTASIRMQDQSL